MTKPDPYVPRWDPPDDLDEMLMEEWGNPAFRRYFLRAERRFEQHGLGRPCPVLANRKRGWRR